MATHEITIRENTGATKTAAPYLGNYVNKETVNLEGFIDAVAREAGLSAIQCQAIIEGAMDAWEGALKDAMTRVHTPLGTIEGTITGSFDSADAAFDASRNSLEAALRLDDSIALDLVDLTPSIVSDEAASTKLRVHNVADLTRQRPANIIYGVDQFQVAGLNMVLSDEGASAYLTDSLGVTFDLTIDEVKSKQLFIAHTATVVPAGDYKLVVKSRGGDSEGPLQTAFRKVKVLAPTGAVITSVANMHGVEGTIGVSADGETPSVITGVNFAKCTEVACYWPDLDVTNATSEIRGSTETEVKVLYTANKTGKTAAELAANKCTVTLKFEDGTSASYSDLTWTNA